LGQLDSSWGSVLWHAHKHGLATWMEIVFTYGPVSEVKLGRAADGQWAATFGLATVLMLLAISPIAIPLHRSRSPLIGIHGGQ
jgi:hypothetical protein